MMRYLIACLAFLYSFTGTAQYMEVVMHKGVPAIRYQLAGNETSFSAFKKFGMTEAAFIELNTVTDSSVVVDDEIFLSVMDVLLGKCNGDSCISLYYIAVEGDNFKKIGGYLGNVNPYFIKQINPQLEAVSAGKAVKVGYLPAHILDTAAISVASMAKSNAKDDIKVAAPNVLVKSDTTAPNPPYSGAGYFASEFKANNVEKKTGKAGNFKSLGGWYDGKFYVLVNGIDAGKVVKITNTVNSQFIYAKVVGAMPEIKSEKMVLLARINNAGCAALDIWDDAFYDIEISE